MNIQLEFGFEEVVAIPECREALELYNCLGKEEVKKLRTPAELANKMVREVKLWQGKHPDRDVMEIVPPPWKAYIKSRLK